MARVTGIGEVFLRAEDPEAMTASYMEHLGLRPDSHGAVVLRWGHAVRGSTVWAPFPAESTAFGWPAERQWMMNDRVTTSTGCSISSATEVS